VCRKLVIRRCLGPGNGFGARPDAVMFERQDLKSKAVCLLFQHDYASVDYCSNNCIICNTQSIPEVLSLYRYLRVRDSVAQS